LCQKGHELPDTGKLNTLRPRFQEHCSSKAREPLASRQRPSQRTAFPKGGLTEDRFRLWMRKCASSDFLKLGPQLTHGSVSFKLRKYEDLKPIDRDDMKYTIHCNRIMTSGFPELSFTENRPYFGSTLGTWKNTDRSRCPRSEYCRKTRKLRTLARDIANLPSWDCLRSYYEINSIPKSEWDLSYRSYIRLLNRCAYKIIPGLQRNNVSVDLVWNCISARILSEKSKRCLHLLRRWPLDQCRHELN
jgi:hypothetical protein